MHGHHSPWRGSNRFIYWLLNASVWNEHTLFLCIVCWPELVQCHCKRALKWGEHMDRQCVINASVTQLKEPKWNNTMDIDYNQHILCNMEIDYSPLLIVLKDSGSCTWSDWIFLEEYYPFIQLLFEKRKIICEFGKGIYSYIGSNMRILVMEVEKVVKEHETNYLSEDQSYKFYCVFIYNLRYFIRNLPVKHYNFILNAFVYLCLAYFSTNKLRWLNYNCYLKYFICWMCIIDLHKNIRSLK